MQRHLHAIFLVVLTATLDSSCHKKQASVALPLPAPPTAKPEPVAPILEAPPDTPVVNVPPPSTAPPIATPAPAAAPPQEQPKPNRRGRPAPAAANPGTVTGPAPGPAPATPPRLGTLLSPEQQKAYNTAIDQSLNQAQARLRSIGNRSLTAEQHERVAQVENFIQQAHSLRKSNLAGAKSLAERADVLARDLLASLH